MSAADGSLEGFTVVITRPVAQAEPTARAFRDAGARVELLPLLEVVPPEDADPLHRAAAALDTYDWLLLTSTNTVRALVAARPGGFPVSPRPKVAAVGDATGAAARDAGLPPDLVAEDPRAEGLLKVLLPRLGAGDRLLLPQAADARPILAEGLRAAGHLPEVVAAYAKRLPPESASAYRRLAAEVRFDGPDAAWVLFTSPRGVSHFADLAGGLPTTLRALALGPVTAEALRRRGLSPTVAAEPSPEALVEALRRDS